VTAVGHSSPERWAAIHTRQAHTGTGEVASALRSDVGGSVIGFAIVFVSLVFRSFIPGPTWVWLAVPAIVGPLISGAYTATTDAADLEEPIPVPSGYEVS
jgi:hypothetical protein